MIFPRLELYIGLTTWVFTFVINIGCQISSIICFQACQPMSIDDCLEPSSIWKSASSTSSYDNQEQAALTSQAVEETHVVVLVHGWMGNSKELQYLEETMKTMIACDRCPQKRSWIIRSAESNNLRTFDGIVAGGRRLAAEVNDLIQQITKASVQRADNARYINNMVPRITLSFVGNSLGGLYSRYAISEINLLCNGIVIVPEVFCTLATPHLGVSQNTYLTLPSSIESELAKFLQQTGADLFRKSTVIDDMTTNPKFIIPLRNFRHRRAYANAYNTDFQVPFRTAAFLSETDSIHRNWNITIENSTAEASRYFVSLIVETDQQLLVDINTNVSQCLRKLTLDEMAVRLDALGWTKVFCDMRRGLLRIPNPFSRTRWSRIIRQSSELAPPTRTCQTKDHVSYSTKEESQKEKNEVKYYTSADLLNQYQKRLDNDGWWYVPLGHTLLVANSKTELYSKLNAGGRPMVDQIARDIIRQIVLHGEKN